MASREATSEKTIKIDAATDLMVGDLAHFLRATKKSIVRDAVTRFADDAGLPRGNDRDSIGAGGRPTMFDSLPLERRVRLRRSELVRELKRHGASEIRLRVGDPDDSGSEPALLVVTEAVSGSGAEFELFAVAKEILQAGIEIVSLTKVMRSEPVRLRSLYLESEPL